MFEAKDWRGKPINIGATIVFPTRSGSSLDIVEAVVETIEQAVDYTDAPLFHSHWQNGKRILNDPLDPVLRIGVRRVKPKYDFGDNTRIPISYPDVSRITVLEA